MEVLGATEHGDWDKLDWLSVPLPQDLEPTDVLIQVAYSDVNPVDLQKLHGNQNVGTPIKKPPFVPGFGGSGVVCQVGSRAPQDWKGKRVCFLADPSRTGSYASHIVVDHRCAALLPSNVDLRDAASIPVAGLTAYESLAKVGLAVHKRIEGGKLDTVGVEQATSEDHGDSIQTLLVIGGAGGVGSWILTLARAWHPNLNLVATASTEVQREWCMSLGANKVMNHNEVTTHLQGGRDGSVDAIICLSEPTMPLFSACAEVIKPYGHICLVVAGKAIETLNLSFCFFKCVNVVLETVFSSIRTGFRHIVPGQELKVVLDLLSKQTIRAPLSPDLDSVSDRFRHAKNENGVLKALSRPQGRRGKLIMRIQGGDDLIFMDMKTASLLQIPRQECIQAKILHPTTKGNKFEWKEQASLQEREDLVKKIATHPTLGIVKVTGKQVSDYEDGLDMQEAENVKNLWGVQLKKREKNVKGEELLFLDPRHNSVGEISRTNCKDAGLFTIEKNDDGTERVCEAITDPMDRDDVERIVRQTLNLHLDAEP